LAEDGAHARMAEIYALGYLCRRSRGGRCGDRRLRPAPAQSLPQVLSRDLLLDVAAVPRPGRLGDDEVITPMTPKIASPA